VWKTPSGRRAAWLVVADADEIDGPERKFVEALIAGSAELAHLIALAREFRTMIREQQEERLDDWLVAAEKTAFAGFAGGLRRDLVAVRAALSLPCRCLEYGSGGRADLPSEDNQAHDVWPCRI
jgi:transposase